MPKNWGAQSLVIRPSSVVCRPSPSPQRQISEVHRLRIRACFVSHVVLWIRRYGYPAGFYCGCPEASSRGRHPLTLEDRSQCRIWNVRHLSKSIYIKKTQNKNYKTYKNELWNLYILQNKKCFLSCSNVSNNFQKFESILVCSVYFI